MSDFEQRLGASLGQAVVVDNRPGASALVGTEAAAKAPPDGYTLVMATSTNTSLIPNPAVTYTSPGATGTAVLSGGDGGTGSCRKPRRGS